MKHLFLILGIIIGFNIANYSDIYAINCNPKIYGYAFIQHDALENEEFGCLDNPMKVIRITSLEFKYKYFKSYVEFLIWRIKHRNDH